MKLKVKYIYSPGITDSIRKYSEEPLEWHYEKKLKIKLFWLKEIKYWKVIKIYKNI